MTQLFLFVLLTVPAFFCAMHEKNKDLYLRDEQGKKIIISLHNNASFYHKNNNIYVPKWKRRNGKIYLKKEIFKNYYQTFNETMNEDDAIKQMTVSKPLFINLCVQASKDDSLSKNAFNLLLDRIKHGEIDIATDKIHATKKDIYHRLLTYIPYGNMFCLINGKQTRIMFQIKTIADTTSAAAAKIELTQFDNDLFPAYDAPDARSFKGVERQPTGEIEVHSVDYDFASDSAHFQQGLNKFNDLLNRN